MNPTLESGVLPDWSPYGVVAGSAVLAGALLLAAGAFSVALLLVFPVLVAMVVTYTWSRRVEGPRRAKDRLITLAIVAALFTAAFEPVWVWALHGYDPMFTLRNDLTLDLGVPPAWEILVLGLAIAAAGGFSPRAYQGNVDITRDINGKVLTGRVLTSDPLLPGDTVYVRERLF